MKNTILSAMILSAIAISTISFSSCKKDTKTTIPPVTTLAKGKCSVTTTISGAYSRTYKSNESISQVAASSSIINIASSNTSALGSGGPLTEQFEILLPTNIAVGSYKSKFGGVSTAEFAYVAYDGTDTKDWSDGSLETSINYNITKSSAEEVEGNFEGTMGNTLDNTTVNVKGTFSAKF